jgi:DNA-binding beta-propeller fold protein YncE
MKSVRRLQRSLVLAAFLGAAGSAFSQGAATPEQQAAAPTPDGPATYIGRGPTLPNLTENESKGPTPRTALLVGEKGGGLMAIIDPDKLEIVARVYFGGGPHEIATDGRYAYITSALPTGIVVVDVKEQKKLDPIEYGALGSAHGIWAANGHIYVAHENNRIISRIDPATRSFDMTMGTGLSTHLLIVTPDEKTIYFASSSGKQFGVLESQTPFASTIPAAGGNRGGGGARGGAGATGNAAPAPAAPAGNAAGQAQAAAAGGAAGAQAGGGRAGAGGAGRAGGGGGGRGGWTVTAFPTTDTRLEGFAISPDGKEMWGININEHTIMVMDLVNKKLVETFPIETAFSNRLRFTPDGKYVLISELMGAHPTMMVYDAKTRKQVKRLDPGAGGEGILIDPRPEKAQAFYAVSNGNKIAVIDTNTLTIKKYIEGLRTPDGMDWYQAKE